MKKNFLKLFMLLCVVSMFTACDDADEPNINIESDIAGTYKGALDIVMNGSKLGTNIPKNISITKAGISSVNLELKDFSFESLNLGTITIQDCALDKYRDRYTFSGNQTLNLTAPIGECPVVVNGTIVGSEVTANLDITVPALNQTVKVTYKGVKLKGGESSEAKITSFTIDSDVLTEQPAIDEATGKITFKVNDAATDEQLKLAPVFTISPKATVYPASGVVQDFSKNKSVVYTVVAENGTVKEYTVSSAGSQNVLKYSFEEWKTTENKDPDWLFEEPSGLASSNTAAVFLEGILGGYFFPITKDGNAAKIVTMDTKGTDMFIAIVPAVTAGTLFTGQFSLDITSPLKSTQFGIPYAKKPLLFKFSYKYTAGPEFYETKVTGSFYPRKVEKVLVQGKVDECSINAYLYEVSSDTETLNGTNINTSSKVIMKAFLADGSSKSAYTTVTIPFEETGNGTYDPSKKYKLAIVCSSSKEGDAYKGAPESTLWINHLEIIGE